MTLLVFLAGTAWTRIVAADFRLAAHDRFDLAGFFTGGGCALIWAGEIHRRSSRSAATLQFIGRLLSDDLQIEERSNRGRIDAIQHGLEHIKAFFLVFNQ